MKSLTHGFTLIELTIVLALIALLLTIAVPRYFHAVDHGKVAVQRQNLAVMRDAIDKYFGDFGRYPEELDDLVKKKYLRAIPIDPTTEKPDWNIIAPEDQTLGRVYDVVSATVAAAGATGGDPAQARTGAGTPDESQRAPSAAQKAINAR
ncbi:MAG TPA: prepilin-type N-terminal cleavage/methylation domain-containing protein [Burkholderiaceae bacterium]|nr:prepilin-type N-terminal cleavage/methylation domain-containing protein [Burkholderiaceae bacterium]